MRERTVSALLEFDSRPATQEAEPSNDCLLAKYAFNCCSYSLIKECVTKNCLLHFSAVLCLVKFALYPRIFAMPSVLKYDTFQVK